MTYMPMRPSVIEMMYSMIEIGMYKKTRGYLRRQEKEDTTISHPSVTVHRKKAQL